MREIAIDINELEIRALVPESGLENLVYILEPSKVLYGLAEFQKRNEGTGIVTIFGMDWDNDLSPWHEKKVFRKGRDFGGNADLFRKTLLEIIIPQVELKIGMKPEKRFLVGISLAGLFALHTTYFTDIFDGIGSVSGSLWFHGFIDWMEGRRPDIDMAYFSFGSQEKNTKNPIIATVEDCSSRAAEILEGMDIETKLEINPGGHFDDGPIRIEKALRWLLQTSEEED